MKLGKIIENAKSLNAFIEKDSIQLNYQYSRAMVKNMQTLKNECELFESERQKLAVGFAEKTDEEKAEINNQIMEMLETDIDIEILKIPVGVIAIDNKISAKDLMALDFMIDEDEEIFTF